MWLQFNNRAIVMVHWNSSSNNIYDPYTFTWKQDSEIEVVVDQLTTNATLGPLKCCSPEIYNNGWWAVLKLKPSTRLFPLFSKTLKQWPSLLRTRNGRWDTFWRQKRWYTKRWIGIFACNLRARLPAKDFKIKLPGLETCFNKARKLAPRNAVNLIDFNISSNKTTTCPIIARNELVESK